MDEVRLGSRTLKPRRELLAGGRREPIGKRALDILSVLAEAGGEIVTKDELLAAVWPGVIVEENALQVHIVALRKALGTEADRLQTIRGVGYQLNVDPDPAIPPTANKAEAPSEVEPATNVASRPLELGASSHLHAEPAVEFRQSTRIVGAVRSWGGASRWVVIAVGVLAMLVAVWALFGSEVGLRSSERIPVVVRALTASTSGEQVETALASGITDELIVRLRRIPELRIATAAPDGTVPGGAFTNAYVIDGTIRSSGDQLRVAVRLVDTEGEILWSETYDRPLSDLFDVQEQIAAAIAGSLSVSFDVGEASSHMGGTANPEAYSAFMQYRAHQLENEQSRSYLEQAVALDPDYVRALSALSDVYGLQASLTPSRVEASKLLQQMDQSTRQGLAANPNFWMTQASRGMYYVARRDFVAADQRFGAVARLDKGNDPDLRSSLADFQETMGRVRKGAAIRRSNEIIDPIERNDPLRVNDLLLEGRLPEAIESYESLDGAGQRNVRSFVAQFWARMLAGQDDAAMQSTGTLMPGLSEDVRELQADTSLSTKSFEELRRWVDAKYGEGGQFPIAYAAVAEAHLDHPKIAVDLMRLAFERPGGEAFFTLWHPAMADARKTDEFERLVTDLGFVKAWRESGDWGDFCHPVSGTEISCT